MCGIIGYIGKKQASPILLDALLRLEYRGYDSAGVSVLREGDLQVVKRKGKIAEGLGKALAKKKVQGHVGVGHTRWATHGAPCDENSHPHLDQKAQLAIVHNGVIENYDTLKERMLADGHVFHSATDTEVFAHLIGEHYDKVKKAGGSSADVHPLAQAVTNAIKEVTGAFGIAVVCKDFPDVIVGARRGSPLIVGVGEGENFLASDATAIAQYTRQVIYLNENDLVTLSAKDFKVVNLGSGSTEAKIHKLDYDAEAAELGGFDHFMLKEIFEQPRTVANALRGRVDADEATAKFGGLNLTNAELRAIDRIIITACGTSWHAAIVGEYLIEELAHIPVEVEYASEFRYRNAPVEKNTLILCITQSGETADTLAGLREAKRRGHKVLAICNVVGSSIARESDGGIYLHAGPEIGVASTKAFTSQVTVLTLFALLMGRIRMLSNVRGKQIVEGLEKIPAQIETLLAQNVAIAKLSQRYTKAQNFFFLGRQYNFPVALEGALKLKEISYIHAEGYPAAEMKHGPIALIDEETPTVVIIPNDSMYEKTLSNLQEIKARGGPIIAIANEGNAQLAKMCDDVIYVPKTLECLFPLLAVVPLQLLSYHIAVARGCDVDKPRNLAKSVTVE